MNKLHTRGKHVIAEAILRHDVLQSVMRADTRHIFRMRNINNIGSMMAGSAYNGPQSANGIASLFIATGQDEANGVESHAGFFFCELRPDNDLYVAVTLPSLIVATYGGGTGLPTQSGMPGDNGLLWQGQGRQTCGNYGCRRVGGRYLAGLGHRRRGMGIEPRTVWPQQTLINAKIFLPFPSRCDK